MHPYLWYHHHQQSCSKQGCAMLRRNTSRNALRQSGNPPKTFPKRNGKYASQRAGRRTIQSLCWCDWLQERCRGHCDQVWLTFEWIRWLRFSDGLLAEIDLRATFLPSHAWVRSVLLPCLGWGKDTFSLERDHCATPFVRKKKEVIEEEASWNCQHKNALSTSFHVSSWMIPRSKRLSAHLTAPTGCKLSNVSPPSHPH